MGVSQNSYILGRKFGYNKRRVVRPNSYFLGRNSAAHSRSSDMPHFLLWGARLLKTLNIKGRIGFSNRVSRNFGKIEKKICCFLLLFSAEHYLDKRPGF